MQNLNQLIQKIFQDPKDIQSVFSYYSFSINEFTDFTVHALFDDFDLDKIRLLEKNKISEINCKVNTIEFKAKNFINHEFTISLNEIQPHYSDKIKSNGLTKEIFLRVYNWIEFLKEKFRISHSFYKSFTASKNYRKYLELNDGTNNIEINVYST